MPQGFEIRHPRFWANTLLPIAGVGVSIAGIYSCIKKRDPWTCALVLGVTAMLVAGAITFKLLFPHSTSGKLGLALIFCGFSAVCGGVIGVWALRKCKIEIIPTAAAVTIGVFFGCLFPWTQKGISAATIPIAADISGLPSPTSAPGKVETSSVIDLTERLQVIPNNLGAKVSLDSDLTLSINPVLTFNSVSPDRFWTIFSRTGRRIPSPGLIKVVRQSDSGTMGSDGLAMFYSGVGESVFRTVD